MVNDSSSRVAARLKKWIAGATPGSRLPSTRTLVAEHNASPVTVQKALRALAAQGLIESRPGVGNFVREIRTAQPSDYGWQTAALRSPQFPVRPVSSAMRSASNDVIAFHSGYPDRELLPERLVRAALTRAARSDAA
ncbi:GntR family transcriptional regulator, partial [Arthrobacter sp. H14]|uniref:GntR family transcriptional regulator n=1 Tax=Arthrobacter sp. H14 TaxID=1312959 RepID=UPI00055E340E